jgi:hypothetical protein
LLGYFSAVIFHRILKTAVMLLLGVGASQAQLAASLQIPSKQNVTGEPVIAVVTITNHSGRELVFQSDGRIQWLDFNVRTSNGNPVNPKKRPLFGPMKIAAGQTLAREVDLTQHFQLAQPGNFTVSATISSPGQNTSGTTTNRAFFNLVNGRVYWSQKVGIPGSGGKTREFRVLNFTSDSRSQIFAQVVDDSTGQLVRTFLLGELLMLRKPLCTVDGRQRLHVMFLATPTMWVHCVVDTDGKLVSRQIHQRGPQGDPQLLTLGDGTVQVANSIPYDPKAAAELRAKIRKASDRPPIPY